jgi:hypothetical protein
MGIQLRTERRFEGSSSVGRYWLAQCEGFRVKGPGQMSGTVEKVVGTVDPQCPEALVVRGLWRRRSIGVGEVNAVIPAARLIVVDTPAEEAVAKAPRVDGRAVAAAAAGKAGSAARVVGPVARDAAALVLVAIAAAGRLVQYVAVQSGRFALGASAAVRADLRARKQLALERQRRRSATRSTH